MTTDSDPLSAMRLELADDEFYIGYQPHAPVRIRRFVRRVVAAMVIVSVVSAGALAIAFRSPGSAAWAADVIVYSGRLLEHPYPQLRHLDAQGKVHRTLLVQTGKHGAAVRVAGFDGREVRIQGTAIQRGDQLLIEIAEHADAISPADSPQPDFLTAVPVDHGHHTVAGEIIDPKCFLGAMKPGDGKLHKACAIRCISGGIPPMLAARNPDGQFTYYLLLTASGSPVHTRVLPFIAEPVELTGRVREVDGQRQLLLDDDPSAIRRVHKR